MNNMLGALVSRCLLKAVVIVTVLLAVLQPSYSQVDYNLYGVTPTGRLFLIKTGNGDGVLIRSSIGSYSDYRGIAFYNGYFYLVTGGGDLVQYDLNNRSATYIGNAGYLLQDIAIGSSGTAYVILSTNSDGAAESIAQISLSNASVSNIVALTGETSIVSNMRGLTISPSGVIRGASYVPSGTAVGSHFMQINPQTGAISPQFTGGYPYHFGPWVIYSIASHPSTDQIYTIRYGTNPWQQLCALFESGSRTNNTSSYIGGFEDFPQLYPLVDTVSGLVFAPSLSQANSPIVNYLLDD